MREPFEAGPGCVSGDAGEFEDLVLVRRVEKGVGSLGKARYLG